MWRCGASVARGQKCWTFPQTKHETKKDSDQSSFHINEKNQLSVVSDRRSLVGDISNYKNIVPLQGGGGYINKSSAAGYNLSSVAGAEG